MRFKDARLGAGARDLKDQHGDEKQEQERAVQERKEPRENECAEHVDRISNARVDAAGDQLRGPGRE